MPVNDEVQKRRDYARKWRSAMRVFRDGMNQLFLLDQEMKNSDLVFNDADFDGQTDLTHMSAASFEASRASFNATKTFVTGAGNHHKFLDKIL